MFYIFVKILNMKKLIILVFVLALFSVVTNAQPYNFDGLTVGSTGTFANGWVGTPTAGFAWIADNNGTTSSGTGPAVDHTLGTTTGIYMYTEASSPAAVGDSALLVSPNINLTTYTSPALSFWYHMCGTSMGNLYIDIFNGSTWIRDVDSLVGATQSAENDPWLEKTVDLTSFSGTIQIRFRAVCGSSWSSDMAIDDVDIFELPQYDLSITNPSFSPSMFSIPLDQTLGYDFSARINNVGYDTIHNPNLKISIGAWQDSTSASLLLAGNYINLTVGPFNPIATGSYTADYSCFGDEMDGNMTNNTATSTFIVSDSIYALTDSTATGSLGIGAGTTGILGNKIEVFADDTLTSVSFYLNSPIVGDTTFITIHTFDTVPGSIIASSDTLFVPSATGAWYTVSFDCPVVLDSGAYYFIGINEFFNNITIGTNNTNYTPESSWVIFGGNPWQPSEFYGFDVYYLINANFANYNVDAFAGTGTNDTICEYYSPMDLNLLLTGQDTGGIWTDNNATGALSGSIFDPAIAGIGTYSFTYTVYDSCGIADNETITVMVDACLLIDENDSRVQVYPNPSDGIINIDLEGLETELNRITIQNSIGQTVYTVDNTDRKQLSVDISHLPTGLYFLTIESSQESICKKLLLN